MLEWVRFTKLHVGSEGNTTNANVRTFELHHDYKAVLDHARNSGQLIAARDADQGQAVKTIIALFGEETPIKVANRILAEYKNLHPCVHNQDEIPYKFADRFRGLALEYMALAEISATGKDSQLIAIVLSQNAKLVKNTSNAITIPAKAEARKSEIATSGSKLLVGQTAIRYMKKQVTKIKDFMQG